MIGSVIKKLKDTYVCKVCNKTKTCRFFFQFFVNFIDTKVLTYMSTLYAKIDIHFVLIVIFYFDYLPVLIVLRKSFKFSQIE